MAELKIINMDEVAVEDVEWLWYPYIPFGKLTIVHGDGGEGKTTLILQLAALLSRGENSPVMTLSVNRLRLSTKRQRMDLEIPLSHVFYPAMQTVLK